MGYKLAGTHVVGCCEIDPKMLALYEKNLHPAYSFQMDVRDFPKIKIIPEDLRDLDILDGSPPCSAFSRIGMREKTWGIKKAFREGQKKQRLDDLFFAFIDVANWLRPKIIVAENVKGLVQGKAKGYVNEIITRFRAIGYDLQIFDLNSARMGVPQQRERIFFIARRRDLQLPPLRLSFHESPISFGEIRSERGKECTGTKDYYYLQHRLPTDQYVTDVQKRITGHSPGNYRAIFRDSQVPFTLTANGSFYRMCDGMLLSDEDMRNMQTFPQDYEFGDQPVQYVCGMSVPPVMMAHIADEIITQWFGGGERHAGKNAASAGGGRDGGHQGRAEAHEGPSH